MGSIWIYALLAFGIGLTCAVVTTLVTRLVRKQRAGVADDYDIEDYAGYMMMYCFGFTLVSFLVMCFIFNVF